MGDNPTAPVSASPFGRTAERVLFYLLLAVFCARPMVGESYERLEIGFLDALPTAHGPTPATTAWLDTALLATSALVLVRRTHRHFDPALAIGVILLAAAVGVSSFAASDKRLAVFAGTSLLITVLAGTALAALTRERWMCRLLLAAFLATGITSAAKCVRQQAYEFEDTRKYWETEALPELLKQGFDATDPMIVNYQRRMLARDADGFLNHPNVTGSCLMMWLHVSAGLLGACLWSALRGPGGTSSNAPGRAASVSSGSPELLPRVIAAGLLAGLSILLAITVCLTGSRGAMLGSILGLIVIVIFGRGARWFAQHVRLTVVLLAAGYFGVVGLTAAYGMHRGTLPHSSLAFRWHYWTAAARAFENAPLTGLGRGNFGTAYMRYKAAEGTEEVKDPHNVWISLLVELGPLGLAGGLVLAGVCLCRTLRRLEPPPARANSAPPASERRALGAAALIAQALPASVGVLLVQALGSATSFEHPGVALIWGVDVAATWLIALAAALWVISQLPASGRTTPWLAAGLCAALLAALVHGLIDFALLTPAGLGVFALCTVSTAGTNEDHPPRGREAPRPRVVRIGAGLVALGLVAAHLTRITLPLYATDHHVEALQALTRDPGAAPADVTAAAQRLACRGWADAFAARVAARSMLNISRLGSPDLPQRLDSARTALGFADLAIQRNPADTNNHVLRATTEHHLAATFQALQQEDEARAARRAAAESWQHAVTCYPTNPRTRIAAGTAWLLVWQDTDSPGAAAMAREHFLAALRIDDSRPVFEVVRLRPAERARIDDALRELPAPAPTP